LLLRDEPLDSPASRDLIALLDAEIASRYPEPGALQFRLDPDEVAPGRGAFVVAFAGELAVACGGVRVIDGGAAEVKRMFVVPAQRGRGVAGRVLAVLEERARGLGATRLVLETGTRQPEAIALYVRSGFSRIEPFGEYVGEPLSVCMGKSLAIP
jgi:GNAT superfamily N-acetyltransferase